MNKIAHGIVLAFFGTACWFTWGLLHISGGLRFHLQGHALPAYTRLCMGLGPSILTALVAIAAAYCLWVWVGKAASRASWVAFLATTTGALVFVMLLVGVAAYLPLLDALNQLPH
jgi:hypothetical protein